MRNLLMLVAVLVAVVTSGCASQKLMPLVKAIEAEPTELRQLLQADVDYSTSHKIRSFEGRRKLTLLRRASFGLPVILVSLDETVINNVSWEIIHYPATWPPVEAQKPTETPVKTSVKAEKLIPTVKSSTALREQSDTLLAKIALEEVEDTLAVVLQELDTVRGEKELLEAKFERLTLWRKRWYTGDIQWKQIEGNLWRQEALDFWRNLRDLVLSGLLLVGLVFYLGHATNKRRAARRRERIERLKADIQGLKAKLKGASTIFSLRVSILKTERDQLEAELARVPRRMLPKKPRRDRKAPMSPPEFESPSAGPPVSVH